MDKASDYRAHAAEVRERAALSSDWVIKYQLLRLADEFDRLAEPDHQPSVDDDYLLSKTMKRILYVEDDADVRDIFEQILVGDTRLTLRTPSSLPRSFCCNDPTTSS